MTRIINLFAGPGTGKSTTAAGLFYEMKLRDYDVELVREYAKTFAYGRTLPSQAYLFAKQVKAESQLIGQVQWIITDSPIWLSAVYGDPNLFVPLIRQEVEKRRELNFFLRRYKPYHQNGRYQNEEEAKQLDFQIKEFLEGWKIPFYHINGFDRDRVTEILNIIEKEGKS